MAETDSTEAAQAEQVSEDMQPVEAEPAEEAPAEECPPCKSGAPAWMATFADMATLLMAFFVLLLSFAHVNVPKYKEVSGSMRVKFGTQRLIPDIEPPKATNLVVSQYMAARTDPTPLRTVEEQRTDEPQPEEEELRSQVGDGDADSLRVVESLQEQLAQQIAEGKVRVAIADNQVQVEVLEPMPQGQSQAAAVGAEPGQIDQDRLEIYAAVAQAQTRSTAEIQLIDSDLLFSTDALQGGNATQGNAEEALAQSRYEQIRASLRDAINQGLAQVERDGERVIIRLAEQGSFESGQAELQGGIIAVLNEVGASLSGEVGLVSVEGHTDDVPLAFSPRFRSNWDLSAARASAVADYLLENDFIIPGKVNVLGFADTRPVASNDSLLGRAQNRRIEIVVNN